MKMSFITIVTLAGLVFGAVDANETEDCLKLEIPQKVATVIIRQGSDYFGAEEYELLYMQDDQWKSLVKGTMLGQLNVFNFEPVTGQKFRLIVSRRDRQIMIREFQLFGPESE
jgi:hypothetical protein